MGGHSNSYFNRDNEGYGDSISGIKLKHFFQKRFKNQWHNNIPRG
jgi:hypothetical protein